MHRRRTVSPLPVAMCLARRIALRDTTRIPSRMTQDRALHFAGGAQRGA